jgi:hypothetical protein
MTRLMNCVCGHADRDHVLGGRCRVPDCPCQRYEPGDTVAWLATRGEIAWTSSRTSSRTVI